MLKILPLRLRHSDILRADPRKIILNADELLRMRNFGKKSLDEIKERLAARGLIEPPVPDESEASLSEPETSTDDETESDVREGENY